MNPDKLKELQIAPEHKRRPKLSIWIIGLAVCLVTALAIFFALPRGKDQQRVVNPGMKPPTNSGAAQPGNEAKAPAGSNSNVVLTVSGYIVNHERIEISPRFLGV